MLGKILLAIALCLGLAPVRAEQVQLNPEHPQSYTVVEGDTLWDIASRFLAEPWRWSEVWRANPQIKNPHLIYPGDVITLSEGDEQPSLQLARGAAPVSREVKLSPVIRESARAEAIPPIPLGAIRQFLSRPLVLDKVQLAGAGYVLGSQDEHLAVGPGSKLYVRGIKPARGDAYSIFRTGVRYRDPATGEFLGYEALHIADITISRFDDPATASIGWANREVLKGDRVLPQEEATPTDFVPRSPERDVEGQIIAVVDGVSQVSVHNVVILNLGRRDGLEPGHVLAIFQRGLEVEDRLGSELAHRAAVEPGGEETDDSSSGGRVMERATNALRRARLRLDETLGEPIGGRPRKIALPEERAGELMVFRVSEKISFALVMNTQRPLHVQDKVRNP